MHPHWRNEVALHVDDYLRRVAECQQAYIVYAQSQADIEHSAVARAGALAVAQECCDRNRAGADRLQIAAPGRRDRGDRRLNGPRRGGNLAAAGLSPLGGKVRTRAEHLEVPLLRWFERPTT